MYIYLLEMIDYLLITQIQNYIRTAQKLARIECHISIYISTTNDGANFVVLLGIENRN